MSSDASSMDVAQVRTPVPFDLSPYRQHLRDCDLTEEQQTELLTILWHILVTFVDLGFGVDSVQTLLPASADAAAKDEAERVEPEPSGED